MKFAKHNFDGEVFKSLLNDLSGQVTLHKKEAQKTPEVKMNFTTQSQDKYNDVVSDELKFFASELLFAAKIANIGLTGEDLNAFAQQSYRDKLKGKDVERAARKFCNNLVRNSAAPIGHTTLASVGELISASQIVSASYPAEEANIGASHKYLGMSKNPNSIWDNEALQRMAQKADGQIFGDEKIAKSKKIQEELKKIVEANSVKINEDVLPSGAARQSSTEMEVATYNQKMPNNALSMFESDRDFSKIAEKSMGEVIKEQSEIRANKSKEAKSDWEKVPTCKKADHSGSFLFNNKPDKVENQTSKQRSKIDSLFDGMLGYSDKKK